MSQIQSRLRTQSLTIYLIAGLVCSLRLTTIAGAQDSTRVPTVTLLKRIAEAVDSRRTGRSVFVVTNVDSMNVTAVLPSRDDAMELLRRLGRRYDIHGPYRTELDLGPLDGDFPADCVHDRLSTFKHLGICPPERLGELLAISLVVTRRDSTTRSISIPLGTDAIFLSLSAFDKFVFPYYERVMGLEATAAWRARMVERMRRR